MARKGGVFESGFPGQTRANLTLLEPRESGKRTGRGHSEQAIEGKLLPRVRTSLFIGQPALGGGSANVLSMHR
jgi:hypothetical protein